MYQINPGELRNHGWIQALPTSPARGADGGELRTPDQWKNFADAWAKIDTRGGKEFYAAKSVNASLSHELTIYWQAGITPQMRFFFPDPVEGTNRYFDIKAIINPDPGLRWVLLLHCTELVGREATS